MSNTSSYAYKCFSRDDLALALENAGYPGKAERFRMCGEDKIIIECGDCGNTEFYKKTCKLRICNKCDSVSEGRIMKKYRGVINHIDNPKLVTLTIKNKDDLDAEDFREIRDAFYDLRDRLANISLAEVRERAERSDLADEQVDNQMRKLRRFGPSMEIKGGMYALETKNTGNGWNTHIHIALDCPYIPQFLISDLWNELTGNQVVDIRAVGNSGQEAALSYLVKYLSKMPQVESTGQAIEYLESTHGLRMFGTFGKLYNISPEESEGECPECGSNNLIWLGSMSFWSSAGPLSGPPARSRPEFP